MVGGVALIAFVIWEIFYPSDSPLVPIPLVRDIRWLSSVVVSGLAASLYYALSVIWPSMVTIVYTTGNSSHDGLMSSIIGAGWLIGEMLSGFLAERLGRIRLQTFVTFVIFSIFISCMYPPCSLPSIVSSLQIHLNWQIH